LEYLRVLGGFVVTGWRGLMGVGGDGLNVGLGGWVGWG